MTISGIFESLIAAAIWALLAYFVYKIRTEIKAEDERHSFVFDCMHIVISDPDEERHFYNQDLYLSINLLLNGYQRKLDNLNYGRIVSFIFLVSLVLGTKNSDWPIANIFISLFFIALIGLQSFDIQRLVNRIDELDHKVIDALKKKYYARSVIKKSEMSDKTS